MITFNSKGILRHACEKIPYQGFSVLIDSNRYQKSPKNLSQFFELRNTQGDHALFRPWEFLRKITKNLYNGSQGFNIL